MRGSRNGEENEQPMVNLLRLTVLINIFLPSRNFTGKINREQWSCGILKWLYLWPYLRQKFLVDCGTGGFVVMGVMSRTGEDGELTYKLRLTNLCYRVCLIIYFCFAVSLWKWQLMRTIESCRPQAGDSQLIAGLAACCDGDQSKPWGGKVLDFGKSMPTRIRIRQNGHTTHTRPLQLLPPK